MVGDTLGLTRETLFDGRIVLPEGGMVLGGVGLGLRGGGMGTVLIGGPGMPFDGVIESMPLVGRAVIVGRDEADGRIVGRSVAVGREVGRKLGVDDGMIER